jgi:hypothetical protein
MKLKRVPQNCFRPAAVVLTVLSLFLIPMPSVSDAACLENPGAFWPLDEDGTAFVDTIGSLQATCSGSAPTACPTTPVTGAVGNAPVFNASSTGLNIAAANPAVQPFDWGVADSFSIELWLKAAQPKPLSNTQVAIGRVHIASIALRWYISIDPSTGFAKARLGDRQGTGDTAEAQLLGNTVDLTDGAWHHVVLTRNVETEKIGLYVDGALEDSKSVHYTDGFESQSQPMTIGYLNSGSYHHFEGSIDEVALYDSALTPGIIKSHFDNGALGQTYCADVAPSVLTSPEMNKAIIGYSYEGNFMASGNPLPTFTLGANPPTGLTISDAATGEIDWLPLDSQYPTVSADVTAQNSVGSDTQAVPIDVYDLCTDFLSALWPLDEDTSPFVDTAGSLEASCSGTAPTNCPDSSDTDSILGKSLVFSPTDETGLDVAANSGTTVFDWAQEDSFSIEAWVKPAASLSRTQVAIGRIHEGATISLKWWLGVRPDGIASAQIIDRDGNGSTLPDSRTSPVDLRGDWHLLGLVRDASVNQIRLYVDGELAASATAVYTAGFNSNTNPLNIGYLNDASNKYHFTGLIDQVALYNTALTASVFATHYQNRLIAKGYCNSAPAFIASNPDPVPTTATEGQLYTVDFNATDADPDTLTWSLLTAPTGMQIDSAGVVTWTPAAPITSPVSYQVMVHDNQGGTSTQNYTVDVTAASNPPSSGGSSGGGGGGGGGCFIDSIR